MISLTVKALLEGAFGSSENPMEGPPKSQVPLDAKGNPITLTPAAFDVTFAGVAKQKYGK